MSEAIVRRENPNFSRLRSLAIGGLTSSVSRRIYSRAIDDFASWCHESGKTFGRESVQQYKTVLRESGLSPSSVNVKLCAIRRLAGEAAQNGYLSWEAATSVKEVEGVKSRGLRIGRWLSREQSEALIAAPPDTLLGKRDRAILAVAIGCGLRRDEIRNLDLGQIQQREARWVVVDVIGKGNRIRSVPMPPWSKLAVDRWAEAAGLESGPIFRAMRKGDAVQSNAMSDKALYNVVRSHGAMVEPGLAPHDLRRTFGRLAHRGGSPIEQIQIVYGHASVQTTERYLGIKQDIQDAPCDHLGLRVKV